MKSSIPTTTSPIYPHHPTRTRAGRGSNLPDRALVSNSDDARNPPSEPYRDLLVDAGVLKGLMGTGAMRGRLGVCCGLGMMVEKYREKNNYI